MTPMIYRQASRLPRIPDLERITPFTAPAQSCLTELHLVNCNPFALGFCLMQWQKSTNNFLCSFNSLRNLRVVDSFSTLPLLAPGILHQVKTLRLVNVSCGEPVASKLARLGPGATDFAATLEKLGKKWILVGSLTFNLDRCFYRGFVRVSSIQDKPGADSHLQGEQIEAALRKFRMLEYLGIVTPVVCDTEQQLDLCTGITRIIALEPRIRSPQLKLLKIEMGRNLCHNKLPPYGWARALQRKQTWQVCYRGPKLAVWETDQAVLDRQLIKAIGQPYDRKLQAATVTRTRLLTQLC